MNFPVAFLCSPLFQPPCARWITDIIQQMSECTNNDCKMLIICWFFIFHSLRGGAVWRCVSWEDERVLMKTFFPHCAHKTCVKIFVRSGKATNNYFLSTEQIFSEAHPKCKASVTIIVSHIFSERGIMIIFLNGALKINSMASLDAQRLIDSLWW